MCKELNFHSPYLQLVLFNKKSEKSQKSYPQPILRKCSEQLESYFFSQAE